MFVIQSAFIAILTFLDIASPDHRHYKSSNISFEKEVILLVNQHRVNYGLKPLSIDIDLTQAARYHALDMGINNYFSHDSKVYAGIKQSSYRPFYERVKEFFKQTSYLGENIAAGHVDPVSVVDGWMKSKGHRENILNPKWSHIGVGYIYVDESTYGHYWVQEFAGC